MQLSRHFYAIAGILVILTAASLGAGGQSLAKTQPMQVFVTNSTSNPVNTKAVGTTQVSGTVTVGNSSPIVVHNDSDDRIPVRVEKNVSLDEGTSGIVSGMYQVPAGKMLVMETEALTTSLAVGDHLISAAFKVSGSFDFVPIKFSLDAATSTGNYYSGVSTGKYYFTEGTFLLYDVARSDSTNATNAQLEFSGYLVPMPASAP